MDLKKILLDNNITAYDDAIKWLSEKVTYIKPVSSTVFLKWAVLNNRIIRIHNAAYDSNLPDVAKNAAIVVDKILNNPSAKIDLSDGNQVDILSTLVDYGILTNDEKAEIFSIVQYNDYRYKTLGYKELPIYEINNIFKPQHENQLIPDGLLLRINAAIRLDGAIVNTVVSQAAGMHPVSHVDKIRTAGSRLDDPAKQQLVDAIVSAGRAYLETVSNG